MSGRYKAYRATTEPSLHVICKAGLERFDALPERVRRMGPWQGGEEGDVVELRAAYRAMIAEQGFVVLFVRQDLLQLEAK